MHPLMHYPLMHLIMLSLSYCLKNRVNMFADVHYVSEMCIFQVNNIKNKFVGNILIYIYIYIYA